METTRKTKVNPSFFVVIFSSIVMTLTATVILCTKMKNETAAIKSETASILANNRNIAVENEEMSALILDQNELYNVEAHKNGKIFAGEHVFAVN